MNRRGWMIAKEVEVLHHGKMRCIYRQDGSLYAVCVGGRLRFSGPYYDRLIK